MEHEWPWQVGLFIDDAWFCGGSLISENYVLTAAHCAEGASYFDIMAGAHNVRESSEPHRVEITSYNGWTHPQWDHNTLSNDVALIELPSPIEFNDYISPSCSCWKNCWRTRSHGARVALAGGSLISENYVLTAAHCAEGASYFDIMAGAHNVRE